MFSGIVVGDVKLFEVADFLCADIHFLAHILERHTAFVHHDHNVIEHIVDLTDQFFLIAVFLRR